MDLLVGIGMSLFPNKVSKICLIVISLAPLLIKEKLYVSIQLFKKGDLFSIGLETIKLPIY